MSRDAIERNLMLFLDPGQELREESWRFVAWRASSGASMDAAIATQGSTVYCFERRDLVHYLFFSLRAGKRGTRCRKVLYLNDGLLSSMFEAGNTEGYRAFAARHLAPPKRLRQRLVSLLPPALRAERRFVVLGPNRPCGLAETGAAGEAAAAFQGQDFMFFSNPSGKLLLTSARTLRSGTGPVLKTTATPAYAEVMEQEFATMLAIAELQAGSASLPRVGARLRAGQRIFFTEAYVAGQSLRDLLHRLSRQNDLPSICGLLDRLDQWFEGYRGSFRGDPRPLASCYQHLFQAFATVHGERPEAGAVGEQARRALAEIAGSEVNVTPVTAHNDLWPGNFVVGAAGLVAIDWERAVADRAPLFDYYWMIVSAALEHLVSRIGAVDYSSAFRLFLEQDDEVTRHASATLMTFLHRLGLDGKLHHRFLLLFLLEWSVQGFLALGRLTEMDTLAFEELVSFAGRRGGGEFP